MSRSNEIAHRPMFAGNFFGAFSDAAILFPLIAVLSKSGGLSSFSLLLSAGLAYLWAGYYFKVPMSVQPLKSIAFASVAIGASIYEIRLSAFLLAAICLAAVVFRLDRFASKVPTHFIQAIQFGLGILLLTQGMKAAIDIPFIAKIVLPFLLALVFLGSKWVSVSFLGLIATASVIWGLIFTHPAVSLPGSSHDLSVLRFSVVASLVLPQILLTFSNSVMGTAVVAHEYFKQNAKEVTIKKLLISISGMNFLAACFSGLPMCHGSGGLTAHVKGGAHSAKMNWIIGIALVTLSLSMKIFGMNALTLPKPMLAVLLIATGIFHLRLAHPKSQIDFIRLVWVAGAVWFTQNLLSAIFVVFLFECGDYILSRRQLHS